MRTRILVASLFVCLAATLLPASQTRGDLVGKIVDGLGAVLPGVRLVIEGPDKRTAITDERGEFKFLALMPGRYSLVAELTGFTTTRASVTIATGRVENLTLRMSVGTLSETVSVSGETAGRHHAAQRPSQHDRPIWRAPNTERYQRRVDNAFRQVSRDPLSTFSIDVDTASYANVRRFLNEGAFPPVDAVRVEEMINYFRYDYPLPTTDPVGVSIEVAACPWNTRHRLALIGLQSRDVTREAAPSRNLVFLIDVSGSMDSPDKLPLVRNALRMLTDVLTLRDRVAIVVYAGHTGVALPPTPGDQKTAIHAALARLTPGGSTYGEGGIKRAYQLARDEFMAGGVNRVILATDGDFNVGVTNHDELIRLIEEERKSGVFLSVLGVGSGNLNDAMMEQLADHGNGNYSYLDSLHEARKVLVREASATLIPVAKDVKIQVEFNPATVAAYRLVGYENRLLNDEDFNDDSKDAGEIGMGHSVTALYEIVPVGAGEGSPTIDVLKYQPLSTKSPDPLRSELGAVKVRYQPIAGGRSQRLSQVIPSPVDQMKPALGFASAVAEFGMLLRNSPHVSGGSYPAVLARARAFRGADTDGDRAEFVKLVETAASLQNLR